MVLTPDDIVNKEFETTRFRDGYDQIEVDEYLDEIATELRRAIQENDALKARLAELGAGGTVVVPPAKQTPVVADPVEVVDTEVASEPVQAHTAAPVGVTADAGSANLLALAQRVHDEHVSAGETRRDELIAEAEKTATRIEEAAELRRTELESEFEVAKKQLERRKEDLESKIDELKTFERDYRLKLRGYIESQLRDLDRSSSLAFGNGNPANPNSNNAAQ